MPAVFVVVLANSALSSAEANCVGSGSCKTDRFEESSMIQLGRAGQMGRRAPDDSSMQGTGGPASLGSKPWFGHRTLLNGTQVEQAPLLIDEDGVLNKYYLMGANIEDGGKTVKYVPPYRLYLMKTPTEDYSKPENFYKPIFPGKTFTVDIDFRKDGPGCGCNLNFYLVDMPASSPGKDNDYYCDAQCFQGMGCCPEFDMNEGNKMVQQVTNHACTGKGSYPGHPDWECNKWGDPELKTHPSDLSPGDQHTINTDKPFTYSQRFDSNGGDFIFTTTMSQEGRTKVLKMGPGNAQLNDMLKNLEKGLAFVTGYWFDSAMNWMDGEECGQGPEECNKNPAYISNWRITSNDKPVPTPAPTPAPPTPPTPPTPPPVKEGQCCWGSGCTSCQGDPSNYCSQKSNCEVSCGGQWCPK